MRLCEIYTSIQGEGPNTGTPITFVRFGGCNLRCSGWGFGTLPDGTEVAGCDTTFAVYPEWGGTWQSRTPGEVLDQIPQLPKHVCLTGGEPLIQPTKQVNQLAHALIDSGYKIDLFTNGTQSLMDYTWTALDEVTVVMDWKLPGSGEHAFYEENLNWLQKKDALKFVVKDRRDFDTALSSIDWANQNFRMDAQVWFGPVWGEMDPSVLATWVQYEAPNCHLNIQTHKYIWHPDAREV